MPQMRIMNKPVMNKRKPVREDDASKFLRKMMTKQD